MYTVFHFNDLRVSDGCNYGTIRTRTSTIVIRIIDHSAREIATMHLLLTPTAHNRKKTCTFAHSIGETRDFSGFFYYVESTSA